ncbi:MAG: hypothetical protein M1479_10090 [Actinobacteria bacterium]|nr:hypothetical protein [Actinomycetota bacterium]
MSCYFRHLDEIFKELDLEIIKENKKDVDKAIHKIVNVEYKNCPATWKKVKEILRSENKKQKLEFIVKLKKELNLTQIEGKLDEN